MVLIFSNPVNTSLYTLAAGIRSRHCIRLAEIVCGWVGGAVL